VAAAVAEASDVADERPVRPEHVPERAAGGRLDDPLAVRGQYEVTDHMCILRWPRDVERFDDYVNAVQISC
jgi:hypothetical protein